MKTIQQTYQIKAPVTAVWQALTDPAVIDQWGGGPATMSTDVGAGFSLWDGDIHGTVTRVVENELLEQNWSSREINNQITQVAFSLSSDGQATTIELVHSGVPDAAYDGLVDGWQRYYMGPMQEFLQG